MKNHLLAVRPARSPLALSDLRPGRTAARRRHVVYTSPLSHRPDLTWPRRPSFLVTCVTLLFGLIGAMNRMRFSSDAPIQKGLGMVTDTWGR